MNVTLSKAVFGWMENMDDPVNHVYSSSGDNDDNSSVSVGW